MLCSAEEWAAVAAVLDGSDVAREHLQVHVVLGAWQPFYPFNVMRNAALEPWNSAHAHALTRAASLSADTDARLLGIGGDTEPFISKRVSRIRAEGTLGNPTLYLFDLSRGGLRGIFGGHFWFVDTQETSQDEGLLGLTGDQGWSCVPAGSYRCKRMQFEV
jgi:hypothetical protein